MGTMGLKRITASQLFCHARHTFRPNSRPGAITGLMGLTGFAAGAYDPREPMWTKDVGSEQSDFQNDIAAQEKINQSIAVANPSTDPNYVVAPKQARFADPTWADFLTSLNPTQLALYYTGHGTDKNGDGLGGTFQVYACAVVLEKATPYVGYQFDAGGLITDTSGNPALAHANINHTNGLGAVRTWEWVADATMGH